MSRARTLLMGLGLGVGAMYYFDPDRGRRRRSLLRDRCRHSACRAGDWLNKAVHDLEHRLQGRVAEVRSLLDSEEVPDDVLVARIRAKLGHSAVHPRSIEVQASDGRVTLTGDVSRREADRALEAVLAVRGVRSVDGRLRIVREDDGQAPAAAGTWSPAARLAAGAGGIALMLNCLLRRSPLAVLLGTFGFGMFLRAGGNRPLPKVIDELCHDAALMISPREDFSRWIEGSTPAEAAARRRRSRETSDDRTS